MDIVFIVLILAFFLVAWGLVKVFERL